MRMARARAVAVLNAAMRIAWVISLVWMSRTCWPGLTWARGSLAGMARWAAWAVSRKVSAARRSAVSLSWSALVISRVTPGGGDIASSRAASVAARARSYLALAARTCLWAFFLAGLGTIRAGSSSVVAYASWESKSECIRAYRK